MVLGWVIVLRNTNLVRYIYILCKDISYYNWKGVNIIDRKIKFIKIFILVIRKSKNKLINGMLRMFKEINDGIKIESKE